jgi:hypothetical protein
MELYMIQGISKTIPELKEFLNAFKGALISRKESLVMRETSSKKVVAICLNLDKNDDPEDFPEFKSHAIQKTL